MRGSTPVKRTATTKTRGPRAPAHLSRKRLAEIIEEATVDAYDESEQATGWYTMFEQYLELPFETKVLGVAVAVASCASISAMAARSSLSASAAATVGRSPSWISRCRRRSRPAASGSRRTDTG
jgi:hypothetical protein